MSFKRRNKLTVDVNLTPLIDVVFLLLIFFMVSTSFTKQSQLDLELPKSSSATVVTESIEQIEVIIDAAGQYTIDDQALASSELAELAKAINQLGKGDKSLPVVISADAKSPHESVVNVLDIASKLGFEKVKITTKHIVGESPR